MENNKFTYVVCLKKGDEIVEEVTLEGASNILHLREASTILQHTFYKAVDKLLAKLQKKK